MQVLSWTSSDILENQGNFQLPSERLLQQHTFLCPCIKHWTLMSIKYVMLLDWVFTEKKKLRVHSNFFCYAIYSWRRQHIRHACLTRKMKEWQLYERLHQPKKHYYVQILIWKHDWIYFFPGQQTSQSNKVHQKEQDRFSF